MADSIAGQRHDRTALVLYGTETGNSQDVAEELAQVLERLHFTTSLCEMDDVEINVLLKFSLVIFAISTTGQGEFPKNSRKFWKSLLRKRLPPNCLGKLNFTTFGLGDSSYAKFNWTARKLHKRLQQLGAQEVYPRGEADDQHDDGLDGAFLPWKADFNRHLLELYPLPDGKVPIPISEPLPPKFLLQFDPEQPKSCESAGDSAAEKTSAPSEHQGGISNGSILESENITASSLTSTMSAAITTLSPVFTTFNLNSNTPTNLSNNNQNEENPTSSANMMLLPALETLYADPPAVCQQLRGPHLGLDAPVDRILPPRGGLSVAGRSIQLISNKRVTPSTHWQDVRLLTFTIDEKYGWAPGDVICIHPKNFPDDVQALIDLQGWQSVADEPLVIQRTETENEVISSIPHTLRTMVQGAMTLGTYVTLRHLLTNFLDITAIPKRSFLQTMSFYTDDDMHRERLLEFCNPTFTDEFYDYTTRPRRSILEVLADFPSVQIPWNQAACLLPMIRPRQYSIATGGSQSRYDYEHGLKKFDILVAMVKYKTVLKKIRQGVCSRYLSSLGKGTRLQVDFDRPSANFFNVAAKDLSRHVLMVAAGTGIAPCRSLVWERADFHHYNPNKTMGEHLLIYGGRNRKADYFFEKEWTRRHLTMDVLTAFSRDQKEKIYVQDIIRKQAHNVYQMIISGSVIYVCGSAGAMPKAVREAFVDVLVEFIGVGDGRVRDLEAIREEAIKTIDEMVKEGRYVEEVW